MGGLCFRNYGIPTRECRRGISASDRERQREVARAEHNNRSQGAQHRANVGLGNVLAFGIGAINARVNPRSLFRYLRKQAKLSAGTGRFAFQARGWQRCFLPGTLDDLSRNRLDLCGDHTQKRTSLAAGNGAVDLESLCCQSHCQFHFFRSCGNKARLQLIARFGVRGIRRLTNTRTFLKPD